MTNKEKLQRSINALNYKKSQNGKLSNVDEARLKCYEEVVKDLERLEQIDNANPSEALKSFERLNEDDSDYALKRATKDIEIVKQALLKAQEQDKILEIFRKNNYSLIHKDDDDFILSFNLCINDINAFTEWKKEVLDNDK